MRCGHVFEMKFYGNILGIQKNLKYVMPKDISSQFDTFRWPKSTAAQVPINK